MTNYPQFWYVASPYTSDHPIEMQERYFNVRDFCAYCANEGLLVYSPIVHWHSIAEEHDLPKDHNFWLNQDRAMIIAAQGIMVLMIDGWKDSRGVQDEIKFAHQLQRPIQYWDYDGIDFNLEFTVQKQR